MTSSHSEGTVLTSISSLIVTSEICPSPESTEDPLTRSTLGCSVALRELAALSTSWGEQVKVQAAGITTLVNRVSVNQHTRGHCWGKHRLPDCQQKRATERNNARKLTLASVTFMLTHGFFLSTIAVYRLERACCQPKQRSRPLLKRKLPPTNCTAGCLRSARQILRCTMLACSCNVHGRSTMQTRFSTLASCSPFRWYVYRNAPNHSAAFCSAA